MKIETEIKVDGGGYSEDAHLEIHFKVPNIISRIDHDQLKDAIATIKLIYLYNSKQKTPPVTKKAAK